MAVQPHWLPGMVCTTAGNVAVISGPVVLCHPVNEVTQALVCQNFAVTQPKAHIQ